MASYKEVPAIISDLSPQHPGRVIRARPHHSVLALGLPHHMVAQLLVQVDVGLCLSVPRSPFFGSGKLVVEGSPVSHMHRGWCLAEWHVG